MTTLFRLEFAKLHYLGPLSAHSVGMLQLYWFSFSWTTILTEREHGKWCFLSAPVPATTKEFRALKSKKCFRYGSMRYVCHFFTESTCYFDCGVPITSHWSSTMHLNTCDIMWLKSHGGGHERTAPDVMERSLHWIFKLRWVFSHHPKIAELRMGTRLGYYIKWNSDSDLWTVNVLCRSSPMLSWDYIPP